MLLKKILPFVLMILMSLSTFSFAVVDAKPSDFTPYQLTATQITEDEMHPFGSALLAFKINNLPSASGDDALTWYVNIEKKIGNADWVIVSAIPTIDFIADHLQSTNSYTFEQLWNETYDWDGSVKIDYRVQVVLEDLIDNRGGMSGYSNIVSLGFISSAWAVPELQKADSFGLIPPILKGADLTKPITREEFCELAVLLYEEVTDTDSAAVSPNPFTDTVNPQILKAFKLGVTNGVSATKFEPKTQINREQCAVMLFRAIKAIHPTGNYAISDVNDFPDQKQISSWAADAAKYMSKLGIIKGDSKGSFMPKATTTAQIAAGYGMATREAAILMTVRTFDKIQ